MNSIVIKIGGSVFYDDDLRINIEFLEKVINWFENQKNYEKVIFVVGGGKIGRFLLNQVKEYIKSDSSKHRMGIKVTRVNAMMFSGLFNSKDIVYFESITELCTAIKQNTKGAIIGGVVEGWSTDMVAANIASNLNLKIVHKISNIDYIYSSDPNKGDNPEPFKNLVWEEYIKIFYNQIGYKHKPSMNAPIDIECSLFCKEEKIAFRVSGGNLNVDIVKLLNSGTLVSP